MMCFGEFLRPPKFCSCLLIESYDTGQPTWDVPNQDLDENPNAAPPAPSAPPPDMFSNFSGYENTSFGKFLNEN